jgi:hypothetical protein
MTKITGTVGAGGASGAATNTAHRGTAAPSSRATQSDPGVSGYR